MIKRVIYSPDPLDEVLVVVRGGPVDATVNINLAGSDATLRVAANTTRDVRLNELHPGLPKLRRGYHYPLRLRCSSGGPLICLGFSDEEKAALLQPAEASTNAAEFMQTYGMSPSYLERLPYIRLSPDALTSSTPARKLSDCMAVNDEALFIPATTNAIRRSLQTGLLRLEPGEYTVLLHADLAEQSEIKTDLLLVVMDYNGKAVAPPMAFQPIDPGGAFVPLAAAFRIGSHPAGVRCRVDVGGDANILIESIDIMPRPVRSSPAPAATGRE